MKLSPRTGVLGAMLVVVPLASWWLVFRPQNGRIVAAKEEMLHMRGMLDKLRAETRRNDDLERANAEIKESVARIEARLPSTKEVEDIVKQVSDLAVQSGLEAPEIRSAKPVKAAMYMEQPLVMKMSGDFARFYEFVQRVEQLPRITRVPDMKLKRDEEKDGQMSAEFTLSIYFQESRGGEP